MFKSESYRPCILCKPPVDCVHADDSTAEEPCWGDVMIEVETDEGDRIHACRGHAWIWSNPFYRDYLPESEKGAWPTPIRR
jgi:hypothetical protein